MVFQPVVGLRVHRTNFPTILLMRWTGRIDKLLSAGDETKECISELGWYRIFCLVGRNPSKRKGSGGIRWATNRSKHQSTVTARHKAWWMEWHICWCHQILGRWHRWSSIPERRSIACSTQGRTQEFDRVYCVRPKTQDCLEIIWRRSISFWKRRNACSSRFGAVKFRSS